MNNISNNLLSSAIGTADAKSVELAEKDKKLKKACADFETIMIYQLMKTMRQTIPKSGSFSSSQGKDTYEMMLDQKIAEAIANKGEGLGLRKILYNQIKAKYLK
jgi:peptidoglycan hydrolase FlgJ